MPLAPGVVLGIGLGGFLDGILLHQILQWHHMLTSAGYPADSVVNLEINTLFDGLFHAVTWIAVAVGLFLLHRAVAHGAAWSWQRLVGGMAIGWGAFNLVEGVVDHHLLGLHHVREFAVHPLAWDLGFLLLGAGLVVGGALLARRGGKPTRRLAAFILDDPAPLLYHNEPIWRDGVMVGHITSGMFGHTIGRAIGLGYVGRDDGVDAAFVNAGRYEIEVACERLAARVTLKAPYDPAGGRVRS